MTFLEIVNKVAQKVRLGIVVPSVEAATGSTKDLIDLVADADIKVQSAFDDFTFLYQGVEIVTVADTRDYAKVDTIATYDKKGWFYDGHPITEIPYAEWRRKQRFSTDKGAPAGITVMPDMSFMVTPTPDQIYTIYGDGFKTPVRMVNNTDVSLIPEGCHMVIVAQAKRDFAEKKHDNGAWEAANVELTFWMNKLKGVALKGFLPEGNSASDMVTRIV